MPAFVRPAAIVLTWPPFVGTASISVPNEKIAVPFITATETGSLPTKVVVPPPPKGLLASRPVAYPTKPWGSSAQ